MRSIRNVTALVCAVGAIGVFALSGVTRAEGDEGKKPRMYTYYSTWTIPRAKWAEYEKVGPNKSIEHAFSSGTLIGYGGDETVVHTEDGQTHDGWFSAMSMSALLNTLNDVMQSGATKTSVFDSATKHSDVMLVSRYYNWKAGTYKGAYTRTAVYKLKDSAPDEAIDTLAKNCVVPFFEKELASGTIVEYEIDEQALHTESPNLFYLDWITPTADGQDKVLKDLRESMKGTPLCGPAFASWLIDEVHRDVLVRGEATYK